MLWDEPENLVWAINSEYSFAIFQKTIFYLTISVAGNILEFSNSSHKSEYHSSSVPKPEIHGMLLMDMGLMGWIVRRKNQAPRSTAATIWSFNRYFHCVRNLP